MRFSYTFKQGVYRFIFLIIIDLGLFALALTGAAKLWFSYLPIPTLLLYGAIGLLTAIIFREISNFTKGAEGEQKVYRMLNKLPDGYYHFWDFVNNKKGNIDMVVIGPTGVFAIEVKNCKRGKLSFQNNLLYKDGYPFEKDYLSQTYAESKNLQEFINKSTGIFTPVIPLLVFTNPQIKLSFGKHALRGVYAIGSSWLLEMIQESPKNLTPEQCVKIKDAVKEHISII